ncbi:MAG: UPF0175 family protein [Candidatus Helarchaeota archaeon]
MITISARIDKEILDEIDRIVKKMEIDRSIAIRNLLKIGIREYKIKEAFDLLRQRKISIWRAAELADLTYREILDKLKEQNIPFPISKEELLREFDEISSE